LFGIGICYVLLAGILEIGRKANIVENLHNKTLTFALKQRKVEEGELVT
jgi:hypothetical protein